MDANCWKRLLRRLLPLAVLLLPLLLTSCHWDSRQSALDPKGPVAQDQHDVFMVTLYVTGFLWITVGGALMYAIWRFRARKGDENRPPPKQSHGSALVEFGLIGFSTLCLVIIAVPTVKGIIFMKRMPDDGTGNVVKIDATGFQWWWEFNYGTENVVTANELVVPVGRPVQVRLQSGDVIHSFWLPKLAGKVDLVPGQVNNIWFQADETGEYYGQCAEFCGDSHAYMLFRCRVVSEEDYAAWLDHQRSPAALPVHAETQLVQLPEGAKPEQVAQGQQAFLTYCFSCHQIDNEGGKTGPNLTHVASRQTLAAGWLENNPENLYRWIRHPDLIKPGNYMWRGVPLPGVGVMEGIGQKNISDEEVHALVAYLSLLK